MIRLLDEYFSIKQHKYVAMCHYRDELCLYDDDVIVYNDIIRNSYIIFN